MNNYKLIKYLFGLMCVGGLMLSGSVLAAAPDNSIGDFAWLDLNADGIQDAGENGVGSVTVNLRSSPGDTLIDSVTTQPSGAYIFTTVASNDYYVEFIAPPGLTFSPSGVGSNNGVDSDADGSGRTAVFTYTNGLGSGIDNLDAGLHPPTTISDFVWNDTNANGIQDIFESGLGGVTVNLFESDDTPAGSTTTSFDGLYSFSGMAGGDYYVEFEKPIGFTFSPQDQGNDTIDSDANTMTGKTAVFPVANGTNRDDIDAGLFLSGSIGDFVWDDANGNGVQEGGELGINNVTVTLYDSGDTEIDNTTTNASGIYTFTDLIPNTYYLEFSTPAGFLIAPQNQGGNDVLDSDIYTATGKTDNFSIAFGQLQTGMDAGYYLPGSIGNFVWEDLNGNGSQDGGETGINNVTVNLYKNGGASAGSTTTIADGSYSFSNLASGDYYVEFVPPTGFAFSPQDAVADTIDSDADTGTGQTAVFTLTAGENNDDIDAGLFQEGVIGDFVWSDTDADGIQDGGELGLDGVTVNLFESDDTLADSTVTSGGGAYSFAGVVGGNYYVEFVKPTGFTYSPQNAAADAVDSDADTGTGKTAVFTLSSGATNNDIDAGFFQTGIVGDFVWSDLNSDGIQDGGEPGINNVTVTLYDSGDTEIGNTTTNASGIYTFTNLVPNTYYLIFTTPTNHLISPQDQGGNDATDSDIAPTTGKTDNFTVTFGETVTNMDAGFYLSGSIGGFIWNDLDGSGAQNGAEAGINGVTVDLYDDVDDSGTVNDGDVFLQTKTTSNGNYDFTGLGAGDYLVDVTDTSGLLTGWGLTGGTDPHDVTLTTGQDYNAANFGYQDPETAVIGDFVWDDTNADGIQDGGETGRNGVTVNLYESDGTLTGTTTTAGGGLYSFTGLLGGDYYVEFVKPNGLAFSPQDQAGDDTADSDANTGTGQTAVFTLNAAATNNDMDAGFFQPAIIGDLVWDDTNGDGVQDGGETGLNNVTITLFDTGDVQIDSTTTDASGIYTFTDVISNTYYLQFTTPSGYIISPQDQGGNDVTDSDINTSTGKTADFDVVFGQTETDMDAGYYLAGSIGDFIWNDLNGDGVQDGGEPGFSLVTVALIDDANGNGEIDGGEATLQTKATSMGAYDFTGLAIGNYLVHVTDDADILTGLLLTGVITNPHAVALTASQDYNGADFGYDDPGTASIGDFVWNDLDGDGNQDGAEPGIDGVTIDLYEDDNGNGNIDIGDAKLGTETTAGGGIYDFASLDGGDYILFVTDTGNVLAGFVQTSGTTLTAVSIVPTQDYDDADYGYKDPSASSIGNFIWNDRNGDGVQDAGEPGIGNVSIDMTGAGFDDTFGTGDDVVYTAEVTDIDGAYNFTGLSGGMYRVDVDDASLPAGLTLTGGTDPITVTVAIGENKSDVDLGYQGNASINGTIWFDEDSNGSQDVAENGVSGVVAYLDINNDNNRDSSEPFATSNGTGDYAITSLHAGTYAIKIDSSSIPVGFILQTTVVPSVALSAAEDFSGADFGLVETFDVYLPLIMNNFIAAPDLVVNSVSATNSLVEVVIENIGNNSTSSGFWVDFYVNPNPIPTEEDQLWQDLSTEGIVWGVTVSLAPGDVLTLTYSTDPLAPNLYYSEANSNFTGTLTSGTPIYAQVDSAHLSTTYGGVLEIHEIQGGAYNNITGSTSSLFTNMAGMQTAVFTPQAAYTFTLPPR